MRTQFHLRQTGKFAYRLQAKKVVDIPEWVLNKLNAINPNASIAYEAESFADDILLDPASYEEPELDADVTDDEVRIMEEAANGQLNNADDKNQVENIIHKVLEEPEFNPGHEMEINDSQDDNDDQSIPSDEYDEPTVSESGIQQDHPVPRRYPERERCTLLPILGPNRSEE